MGVLADTRAALVDAREHEVKHSRTANPSYHSKYEEKIGTATKAVAPLLASYEALLASDDERALFAKLGKGWNAYQQARHRSCGGQGRGWWRPDDCDPLEDQ